MRPSGTWAAVVVVVAIGVTSCGDDDSEAAQQGTASFCTEIQALDQGGGDAGPYSEFYAEHAEPTPADWAADGHLVTDALQVLIDDLRAVRPSKEAEPFVADVLTALETIRQNALDVSAAGADGDQSAIDALERVNQDANVPALMTAMQAVEQLCGSIEES